MRCHFIGFNIAFFAIAMASKAPEIWAVVDVDDNFAAVGFGNRHGFALGCIGVGFGKMCSGDEQSF